MPSGCIPVPCSLVGLSASLKFSYFCANLESGNVFPDGNVNCCADLIEKVFMSGVWAGRTGGAG